MNFLKALSDLGQVKKREDTFEVKLKKTRKISELPVNVYKNQFRQHPLPTEMWAHIFSYLPAPELAAFSLVSKKAAKIADLFWINKARQYGYQELNSTIGSAKYYLKQLFKVVSQLEKFKLLPDVTLSIKEEDLGDFTCLEEVKFKDLFFRGDIKRCPKNYLLVILSNPKVKLIPNLHLFIKFFYLEVFRDNSSELPVPKELLDSDMDWLDLIICLLKGGYNANIPDENGDLPIHIAAKKGNENCTKDFFCFTENINLAGSEGCNVLHRAAESGHPEIILFLLSVGADFRALNNKGDEPFRVAINNNHIEASEILLPFSNINKIDRVYGHTALHSALRQCNPNMLQMLLSANCNAKIISKSGLTPLNLALVYFIHAKNSNKNFNQKYFDIYTEIVKTLIPFSDPNQTDLLGNNALHFAAETSKELFFLLVKAKANLFGRNDKGRLAFHRAIKGRNIPIIEFFLQYININEPDAKGNTALHIAAKHGTPDLVKFLLSKGANPFAVNKFGATALHLSIKKGQKEIVPLLLNKENINHPDNEGNTPLHIAASKGLLNILTLLLEEGEANPNLRNVDGRLPLDLALKKNLPKTVFKLFPVTDIEMDNPGWKCAKMFYDLNNKKF